VQTKNTPLKFASSALESRFAPILDLSISSESPKPDLLKDSDEGGSSDGAHQKKTT